ncbi:Nucleic acid-binding, OB-fold [Sesbania bispinosa]|nr:Nucleic acid-binding, OB-fold [Sesbania bispinosa]
MVLVSNGFHSISRLCSRRENWRLIVKLVRAWNMCVVATPNDPFAMKMVFVDEEGEKIEAVVSKKHMHRFSNNVVEGLVYKLKNFGVILNGGKLKATGHDYKLNFNASTRMVACENAVIPFSGFSLVKSDEIRDTGGYSDKLYDEMYKQHKPPILIHSPFRGKLRCAIFGEMVDTVNNFLSLPRNGLPVLIIQFACVNLYKGEVRIQNVMNASKLWWNPEIAEAVDFKNCLAVHEVESDIGIISTK